MKRLIGDSIRRHVVRKRRTMRVEQLCDRKLLSASPMGFGEAGYPNPLEDDDLGPIGTIGQVSELNERLQVSLANPSVIGLLGYPAPDDDGGWGPLGPVVRESFGLAGTTETDLVEAAGGNDAAVYHGEWFVVDSFSFGVEREMKERGEKGVSIGLAQFAINGNSPGQAVIDFVEIAGGGEQPAADMFPMSWDNVGNRSAVDAAIKSWNTSGDADDRPTEEVAFYYNKAAARPANADGVVDAADYAVWQAHYGTR